jgi:hypothetical protein
MHKPPSARPPQSPPERAGKALARGDDADYAVTLDDQAVDCSFVEVEAAAVRCQHKCCCQQSAIDPRTASDGASRGNNGLASSGVRAVK